MKQKFKDIRFSEEKLALINLANQMISEYSTRLTVRQLYYQFVSRVPGFENSAQSYTRFSDAISDGRLGGLVDWNAIEDRGRVVSMPTEFDDPNEAIRHLAQYYRLNRWEDQSVYAELWCEKQALAGILDPIARRIGVPLMINKGYSSWSAMYESAVRYTTRGRDKPKKCFYLGDFDPSGNHMVTDIRNRMATFGVPDFTITKIGLTWEQVQEYDPPPNPAKVNDPRAAAYIEEYGDSSWECDALTPDDLEEIIVREFKRIIDVKPFKAAKQRETEDRKYILSLTPKLKETT
jgi:hypothetical protein